MRSQGSRVLVAVSPKGRRTAITRHIVGSKKRGRVFVAMSGGVDSSVAALLLKKQGYDCAGVFMRCVSGEISRTIGGSPLTSLRADCTTEVDATDARRVAEKIGIPFYVWDFEEEYKRRVVDYMIDGYRQGITPNPDVMCNKEIKFGLFLEKALAAGADYVATGHYVRRGVRIEKRGLRGKTKKSLNSQSYILYSARDTSKDQSYFLWTLTQDKLSRCLFPIGDYLKSDVREIARKAGLPTAGKKDSQGVCFLGKVELGDFLKQYIPEKRGAVLATSGRKIGEHNGAYFYTIGQRHGLNIAKRKAQIANGGDKRNDFKPLYVAEKDATTNTIIVAEGRNHPALSKREMHLVDVNFINPNNMRFALGDLRVFARVRYRQPLARATLRASANNELSTNKRIKSPFANSQKIRYSLIFDNPQKFVASGQSAVFYKKGDGDPLIVSGLEMLGGGIIA